jgi:hypothetical protein
MHKYHQWHDFENLLDAIVDNECALVIGLEHLHVDSGCEK